MPGTIAVARQAANARDDGRLPAVECQGLSLNSEVVTLGCVPGKCHSLCCSATAASMWVECLVSAAQCLLESHRFPVIPACHVRIIRPGSETLLGLLMRQQQHSAHRIAAVALVLTGFTIRGSLCQRKVLISLLTIRHDPLPCWSSHRPCHQDALRLLIAEIGPVVQHTQEAHGISGGTAWRVPELFD
jgi:hypothetical protein